MGVAYVKRANEYREGYAKQLGTRIARIRAEAGVSMHQTAAAIGITNQSLFRIERGHTTPSLVTLARICDRFGVDPGELMRCGPRYFQGEQLLSAEG